MKHTKSMVINNTVASRGGYKLKEKGISTMGKLYDINLWEERVMPFAVGIVKDCDTLWNRETIYNTCVNGFAIKGVKGINGIHVIKTLSGNYWINQISGYTVDRGMFCMIVNPDGTMKNA